MPHYEGDMRAAEGARFAILASRWNPRITDALVAGARAAIVLMHTRGRSKDMYREASYHEVVDEVLDELRESVAFATGAGVAPERIVLDPGLGFAKEAAHTYEVLARLDEFSELGRPLLVGPSRKRFLNRPLGGDVPAAGREWATAAAVAAAVFAGAHIVRVHAVGEMAQVVRVSDEIRKYHRG